MGLQPWRRAAIQGQGWLDCGRITGAAKEGLKLLSYRFRPVSSSYAGGHWPPRLYRDGEFKHIQPGSIKREGRTNSRSVQEYRGGKDYSQGRASVPERRRRQVTMQERLFFERIFTPVIMASIKLVHSIRLMAIAVSACNPTKPISVAARPSCNSCNHSSPQNASSVCKYPAALNEMSYQKSAFDKDCGRSCTNQCFLRNILVYS